MAEYEESPPPGVPDALLRNALVNGAVLNASPNEGLLVPRDLRVVELATLRVRSGRVIVGDVGMGFDLSQPILRKIPPGDYKVYVTIWGPKGKGAGPSDGMGDTPRAAYLTLEIRKQVPTRFVFAAMGDPESEADNPEWVGTDTMQAIGVDMGGVGIIDLADRERFQPPDDVDEQNVLDNYFDFEEAAQAARPDCLGLAGVIRIPTKPPIEVPACNSGWGDGAYFAYWALDAAGEALALIVDFDLDQKWRYR